MMGGDGKSKNSKLFFYILKDNLFGIGKYLFFGHIYSLSNKGICASQLHKAYSRQHFFLSSYIFYTTSEKFTLSYTFHINKKTAWLL